MGRTTALVFIILCGASSIIAQFEDVKECVTSDDFVPWIIDCFSAKFYAMLANLTSSSFCKEEMTSLESISGSGSRIGRKLQSVDGTSVQPHYITRLEDRKSRQPEVPTAKQTIVDRVMGMFLDVSKELSKGLHKENGLDDILEVLQHGRKLNLDALKLILPLLEELGSMKLELDRLQEALSSNPNGDEPSEHLNQDTLDELERIKRCLDGLNEEEFEDGFTWLRCFYVCSDLPLLSSCMIDTFNQNPGCSREPWVADLVLRLVVDYLQLQHCFFEILSPDVSSIPMNLVEGKGYEEAGGVPSQFIEFRSYLPPGVHCFPQNAIANRRATISDIIGLVFLTKPPCVVQIQMTTSNYIYDILPYIRMERGNKAISLGRPRCRNGTAINQISIGWHENAVNTSGIIVLERSNWNATFRIPVAARVDHKVEDDEHTEVNFTIKMVVDNETLNTTKVLTRVYDQDASPSICQSINDPHIVTFDNRYYNNLYQGYFQFYKHSTLPYEVQLIYQSCGSSTPNGESCNCGAAVRSGDDVFVVDRCRLKEEFCSGVDCRLLKVTLYVNEELTPGTRIFQKDGGLSYEVILPHGTIVKIKSNGQELINVWIIPSPYDRDSTLGLCGTFNVNPGDDFTLPNGTMLNFTDPQNQQPREFIEAWRVQPQDRIFEGALREPFLTTNYCRCSHHVLHGIDCHCGYGELVETCDLDLGDGEFTPENITSLVKHSKRSSDPYFNETHDEERRDINETFVPEDPEFLRGEYPNAVQHCRSLLFESEPPMLQLCQLLQRPPNSSSLTDRPASLENAYQGCMDDYKITHSNATVEWMLAATDAAKVGCLVGFERSPKVGSCLMRKMENDSCINECFYRGDCVAGRCECYEGYGGADCGLVVPPSGPQVPILLTEETGLCDKRAEDCAFATIYGTNFTNDASITCTALQIKVLDSEYVPSSVTKVDVDVVFINTNQVACRLPYPASYQVSVKFKGQAISPPASYGVKVYSPVLTFMAYDSICYECDTTSETCSRKQDLNYCLVGGVCYANQQVDASDSCRSCNTSYSSDNLYDSQDPDCVAKRTEEAEKAAADKKTQDIKIAVGCSLSGLIIIISIVAFILTWRKGKHQKAFEKSENSSSAGDKVTYANPEFSLDEVGSDQSSKNDSKCSVETKNNNTLSPDSCDAEVIVENNFYDELSETGINSRPMTPPSTLVVKNRDLARVMNEELGGASRVRTSSVASSSSFLTPKRRSSDAASVKSFGIGGGGPFGYGRTVTSEGNYSDQLAIGAHCMPTAAASVQTTIVSERL